MIFQANALCFGGDLPASGAPCHVVVEAHGVAVRITDASGAEPVVVPFGRLAVSAGGFDHDHLVVKWEEGGVPLTLYLKDPALIRAFRDQVPASLSAPLQDAAAAVRRHRSRRRAFLWAGLGLLGGVLLFLWQGSDWLAEWVVSRIPASWEVSLGETAYRQFVNGQTVLTEGAAVDAVREITGRLTAALGDSPYTFQVAVVESGVVNAFALPGGYVVVFTGLLKKAESAEEVAGVLGHEFSHVLQRHAMERLVKSMGLVAVVTILTGNQQGWAGLIKELGIELATLKFGREQETEADMEGLRLLLRAKIAPGGMVGFFERLGQQDAKQLELLSSHPMSEGRAERLQEEIARLPRAAPEPFETDWGRVRVSLAKP